MRTRDLKHHTALLRELYLDGLSDADIARQFTREVHAVTDSGIKKWRGLHGLKPNSPGGHPPDYQKREQLLGLKTLGHKRAGRLLGMLASDVCHMRKRMRKEVHDGRG